MNANPPRSPEEYLEIATAETAQARRAPLRIYLGMCPGVGKTYTMLEDARRLHAEGTAVLAGIIETHGRVETGSLLTGIPQLPRLEIPYRGAVLHEFDLDAALQLRPPLILVDELAHSNAPGVRHPKRWQDVHELLDAGIPVWTTVNIQHVESLHDAVAGITGVRVPESVPDSFFDEAAEIRLVDLTPDQLRDRLEAGKVYLGERAALAANHFFREGNLSALREMALRFTAGKADRDKRRYMRRHFIEGPWRAGERLMVAVGSSPHSARLVRITRRLAGDADATWIAVHVDTGAPEDEPAKERLAANLALARALGGEVVSFTAEDTIRGLLAVARRENVSQIVAGKGLGAPWFSRLLGHDISRRLVAESGDIDVHLVHPDLDRGLAAPRTPVPRLRMPTKTLVLVPCILAISTLAGVLLEPAIGYRGVAMIYLLASALAGLILAPWASVTLAVIGCLAWNFFFTTPRLSFTMVETGDALFMAATLVVAAIVASLTSRLRRRETASHEREERARALYQLTRVTSATTSLAQGARLALRQVETVFHCPGALLVGDGAAGLRTEAGRAPDPSELAVCQWSFAHQQPAGRHTGTLPSSAVLAFPLAVNGKPAGVLAVWPSDASLASPIQRDLLETFATHFCVLLEREAHLDDLRAAGFAEESRRLQRALLDHVSHEIKTPVAVIHAAAAHLRAGSPDPRAAPLIAEISQAAARLNRVFNQLVTLSRAEAGLIQPSLQWCDATDLLHEVAETVNDPRMAVSGATFSFNSDPALLHTALTNLVSNGLENSEPTNRVDLQAAETADGIRFTVTSHGAPIPEADRERIFERFARGSTSPGGLGLGLPIARCFVEALGGNLALDRSDEGATVFSVSLPRQQPPPAPK